MADLEWFIVSANKKDIGAFGLIGGKTGCVVTFFSDLDGNMDGDVGWLEWGLGSHNNSQLALVTQCAPANRKLLMRCTDLPDIQRDALGAFAGALLIDGFSKAYFMKGVGAVGGAVANKITLNMIQNLFMRQSMSEAVKLAMKGAKAVGAFN
jgi:hypothetical protein